jgi:dTDP-4-dehydrorhamnose reductase
VFDGAAGRPYRPDDPTHPLSVYGRTKCEGEAAVLANGPSALVVRTGWVHSAGAGNFVTRMIDLMKERDILRVVADQVGTPTHAPGLASALWALGRAGASGLHHYSDAGVASWYDFASAIAELAAARGLVPEVRVVPVTSAEFPTAARRPSFSVLDKSRTWALLGGPAPYWRVNLAASIDGMSAHG